MNDHTDIQKLFSPYCDGDLSAPEQARVEEHLASCAACRAELADLRTALRLIRTTPEVEPPPWLAARIMARLREEKQEQRSWLQRLFFPLQVKLPLEALAVVMVCVTGYYLSHTVEPEMQGAVPQLTVPTAPQPARMPAEELKREQSADPRQQPVLLRNEPQKSAQQPVSVPASAPAAPPAFAPVPPAVKEERIAPAAGAGVESENGAPEAESAGKVRDSVVKMKKTVPSRDMQRSESRVRMQAERAASSGAPASAAYPLVTVRMSLADPASADESVRNAVILSGGSVVEVEQAAAERKLKARIPADRLSALTGRLERLGRISQRPTAPDSTGIVEVRIEW